jgi:hypothetical protein
MQRVLPVQGLELELVLELEQEQVLEHFQLLRL